MMDIKEKLQNNGREWKDLDPQSNRKVELLCKRCGDSLGVFDISSMDLKTYMFCSWCVRDFLLPVPYRVAGTYSNDRIEVVADSGNTVKIKYLDGYYPNLEVEKVCYWCRRGRYIKAHQQIHYLNKESIKI